MSILVHKDKKYIFTYLMLSKVPNVKDTILGFLAQERREEIMDTDPHNVTYAGTEY